MYDGPKPYVFAIYYIHDVHWWEEPIVAPRHALCTSNHGILDMSKY